MMHYLTILIIYLVVLNLFTSYRLLNDDYYDRMQKSIQMFIVWILPFFGAILIAHFNTKEKIKLAGIYKRLSLVSRFVAMIFFIKLYSKKESNTYGGGLAVDDMGWREGSMSHESFGNSGGGDA